MKDPRQKPVDPILQQRLEAAAGRLGPEVIAIALSVIWVLAVLITAIWGRGGSSVDVIMTLMVVFMPLALIWVSVTTLRMIRSLRGEAARLQAAVDAMRNAYVASAAAAQTAAQTAAMKPSVEKKLDEIVAAQRQTDAVLAMFTSRRDPAQTVPSADHSRAMVAPRPASATEDQPALALGTPAEDMQAPLAMRDLIMALNFPETAEDRAGFRALRLALEDREASKLVRAAQDVLTLLSQEGIYMDDLAPDRARADVWRRFAAGERGRAIAALGGIRDRSSLALTAARMKEDPIFRDAGHHFLRTFDKGFTGFEARASDADIADLADTRTARAFMLLGRVTGTFD